MIDLISIDLVIASEAKQSRSCKKDWIASELALLAMTLIELESIMRYLKPS
jgi:hypothetical protein